MSSIVLKYYSNANIDCLFNFKYMRTHEQPQSFNMISESKVASLRYDSYSHLCMNEAAKSYTSADFYINSLCCSDNIYNETGKVFTRRELTTFDSI